jgi:hypothetical protein
MPTFTVSASGDKQYPSIQAAWNALPSTLDADYVLECYNTGELGALDTSASAKTMGSFGVTIRPAAGQGYRDNAGKLTAPLRYSQPNGVSFSASAFLSATFLLNNTANITLDGIAIRNTSNGEAIKSGGNNLTVKNCLLESHRSSGYTLETSGTNALSRNNVVINKASDGGGIHTANTGCELRNNTVVYIGSGTSTGKGVFIEWSPTTTVGNAVFGFATAISVSSTTLTTASDYNATDAASVASGMGTHNLTGLAFASQFTAIGTAGSEDLRVKAGSALINAGIYNASIDPDILGQTRSATTPTIGAFEYIAAGGGGTPASGTISWTEAGDTASISGSVASGTVTASISWTEASDTASLTGNVAVSGGTITTPVLKNNTGTVLANETGVIVNVYNQSTGVLVLQKTGLTSNASGVVTITDAALTPGTTYAYEVVLTSNRRRLPLAPAA